MPGSNQHYIPRHLMRGFAEKPSKPRVAVYSRRHGVWISSLDRVGSDEHFYSELAPGPGDPGYDPAASSPPTLDDRISDQENALSVPFVNLLRDMPTSGPVDADRAAECVTFLTIRNAQLRTVAKLAMDEMTELLERTFADPAELARMLKLHETPPSKMVMEPIRDAWKEHRAALRARGLTQAGFERWMIEECRKNLDDALQTQQPLLVGLFEGLRSRIVETARSSHRKALKQSLVPEPRVAALRQLSWHLEIVPDNVVLPDCVAIARLRGGGCLPLLVTDSDDMDAVAMPVSSDRLLVGRKSGEGAEGDLRPTPAEWAGCASEFFVARDRTPDLEALRLGIGGIVEPYLLAIARSSVSTPA